MRTCFYLIPALISKYQYCSNYLGVPVNKTDDWCLETKNGYITKMKLGGIKLLLDVWDFLLVFRGRKQNDGGHPTSLRDARGENKFIGIRSR